LKFLKEIVFVVHKRLLASYELNYISTIRAGRWRRITLSTPSLMIASIANDVPARKPIHRSGFLNPGYMALHAPEIPNFEKWDSI